ncbi:hypothetical protein [Amycolatopsis sp. RTGN1]|uniref:hypothetical protein n=1 Tax=Amycolatopsis ponsaeliensis TaxID=2992142 RepID=UPI002550A4A1|nr:hypothetical protein [Amycolatopsis sp. RTGN1]
MARFHKTFAVGRSGDSQRGSVSQNRVIATTAEALRVLTGEQGPVLAERATRAVRDVEAAAREQGVVVGGGDLARQGVGAVGEPGRCAEDWSVIGFAGASWQRCGRCISAERVKARRRRRAGTLARSAAGMVGAWT